MFTLKFKLLIASLLLFGSIAVLFYNQITLNSKVTQAFNFSQTAFINSNKALDLLTPTATPSPVLAPVVTKSATKSASPTKAVIKR